MNRTDEAFNGPPNLAAKHICEVFLMSMSCLRWVLLGFRSDWILPIVGKADDVCLVGHFCTVNRLVKSTQK